MVTLSLGQRMLLSGFARIHARGEEDATLRALGADRIEVMGDLKLAAPDLPADPRRCAICRRGWPAAGVPGGEHSPRRGAADPAGP